MFKSCISHTLGKRLNLIVPVHLLGGLSFFSFLQANSQVEGLKPVKQRLQIDLVSYPARAEGLRFLVRVAFNKFPDYFCTDI